MKKNQSRKIKAVFLAITAAVFYSISSPVSKTILNEVGPTLLAGLLYLGAGIGMFLVNIIHPSKKTKYPSITKNDWIYVVLMIVLDILAPIFLLVGLSLSDAASISLMNNFEIVLTTLIAFFLFKEKITLRTWIGILSITLSVFLLSIDVNEKISFSKGSFFALLACLCWGLENNCTRKISDKNPFQIVILKGIFSGLGSLIIGLVIGEKMTNAVYIIYALILGFVSYGLSVFCYVIAQRSLGAAKTSAYYAVAPFIGVLLSFLIYGILPNHLFYLSLLLMINGSIFVVIDTLKKEEDGKKESV